MCQDIVNPDDQHCDPVLHVLHAQGVFTQSDLDSLCGGETRVSYMSDIEQKLDDDRWKFAFWLNLAHLHHTNVH